MKSRLSYLLFAVFMITAMALAACQPATTPTPEPAMPAATQPPAPTPVPPTPEPTAVPLGSPENPIVMALAPSATTQELLASGEEIAKQLSELTGYTITTTVPTSYGALVEAMGAGNAHIGWLPPFAYVVAHEKGYADVGLSTVRFGSDHYGFQFIAHADAGFVPAADSKDLAALKQFDGLKPCWTDPLSSSGYVIPTGYLKQEGVSFRTGAWVQGHSTVVKSIYLSPKGEICNFGATFVDARTGVARDFADVNEKVVVVYASDPVIPNDNVSFAFNVPDDVRAKIAEALLAMAKSEAGKAALNAVYQIDDLQAVDDTFYDEFRVYLEASGVDVTSLVR